MAGCTLKPRTCRSLFWLERLVLVMENLLQGRKEHET